MKINILKLQLSDNDGFELLEVNSLKEALKLNLNKHYYLFFKALQFNNDFAREVKNLRIKHKIEIQKSNYKFLLIDQANEVIYAKSKRPLSEKLKNIEKDAKKLMKYFKHKDALNFELLIPESISEIVMTGAVILKNISPIMIEHDPYIDEESGIPQIHIVIGADTSKRSLERFIDKKWNRIQQIQKGFQKPNNFKVSERDLIVLDLIEHNKMKLVDTLDELEEIYPNEVFNYDQIKSSRKNTKDKINSLFKSK